MKFHATTEAGGRGLGLLSHCETFSIFFTNYSNTYAPLHDVKAEGYIWEVNLKANWMNDMLVITPMLKLNFPLEHVANHYVTRGEILSLACGMQAFEGSVLSRAQYLIN